MANLTWKLVNSILGRRGQIWLLFLLLAVAAAIRFTYFASPEFSLDRLAFVAETAEHRGRVVHSGSSGDHLLLLEQGNLIWLQEDELRIVTSDVVNLYANQGRLWVKTRDSIAKVETDSGTGIELLKIDYMEVKGIPFADARLIGIRDKRYYLSYGSSVIGIEENGIVEGPYHIEGRRQPLLVETDWGTGAAFIQGNSWVVMYNFMPAKTVSISEHKGVLLDIRMSPDASEVMYALQQGNVCQVWWSGADGTGAELIYQGDFIFSSLEAIWSSEGMIVLTVLGYEVCPELEFLYFSSTHLFKRGWRDTAVLSKTQGTDVRALIPTAWDSRASKIWFYWLHEEEPRPVLYRLFQN